MTALLLCPMCAQQNTGGSLVVLALIAAPFAVSAAVFWAIRHLDA